MKSNRIVICWILCLYCWAATPLAAQIKVGAIGDSLLDEYFDQEGFGQSLSYARNPLQLLVETNRIDAGPTGNWGDIRNTGYEYNWALAGSTSSSLIADNQHLSLAGQVPSKGISTAILLVGSNDLFPYLPTYDGVDPGTVGSAYEAIYEGIATQAQIDAAASQAVANVRLAAETLKASGVQVIVGAPPEYGISPLAKTFYTDPVKRERVDQVHEAWTRTAIDQLLQETQVPVVDFYRFSKEIWGDHGSENEFFRLGGVDLDLDGTGGVNYSDVLLGNAYSPTADTVDAFTHDGIHPNSIINGLFANLVMTAMNEQYGAGLTLFTEAEMLAFGGPNTAALYSGDTLGASLGGQTYGDFIYSPVPEPVAISGLLGLCLAGATRRRRLAV